MFHSLRGPLFQAQRSQRLHLRISEKRREENNGDAYNFDKLIQ